MKRRAFLTLPIIGAIVCVAKRCFGGCTGSLTVECPTATDWTKEEPTDVVALDCRDGGTVTLADGTVRVMVGCDRPTRVEDWDTGQEVSDVFAYDSRDCVVLSYTRDPSGHIATNSMCEPRIRLEIRRLRLYGVDSPNARTT